MRIAYFTPLNPVKSGISDYSEDLLPLLAEGLDIDIFIDQDDVSNPDIRQGFAVFPLEGFAARHRTQPYDACIYHIGNNPGIHRNIYHLALQHPGIVVMHDYALHHMVAGLTCAEGDHEAYLREMEYAHGWEGYQEALKFINGQAPPPWTSQSLRFPLNRKIIESARGIIVHSYYSMGLIKRDHPQIPVKVIPMFAPVSASPEQEYRQARIELGIPEQQTVIASFGFINQNKRIDKALLALAQLVREGYDFKYYLVGEGTVDPEVMEQLRSLDIPLDWIAATGHRPMEQFVRMMQAADICINLRYPIMGESSASLHRLLGMGKAVLVSNVGPFREYPLEAAARIDVGENEVGQLVEVVRSLLDDPDRRAAMGQAAGRFAEQYCQPRCSAGAYREYVQEIISGQMTLESLVSDIARELSELEIGPDSALTVDCAALLADLL